MQIISKISSVIFFALALLFLYVALELILSDIRSANLLFFVVNLIISFFFVLLSIRLWKNDAWAFATAFVISLGLCITSFLMIYTAGLFPLSSLTLLFLIVSFLMSVSLGYLLHTMYQATPNGVQLVALYYFLNAGMFLYFFETLSDFESLLYNSLMLIAAFLSGALAFTLLQRKRFARIAVFIVSFLGILYEIYILITDGMRLIHETILAILVLIALYLLLSTSSRAAFSPRREGF